MKSRRMRIAALFLVPGALLALAVIVYLLPQREVVTEATIYERIRVGMTEAKVAAAVPVPPGDRTGAYSYTTSAPTCEGELPIYVDYCPRRDGTVSGPHPVTGQPLRGKWWRGNEGQVIIFFGDDGRVMERRYYPGSPRSWVGYQWDSLVP